MSCFVGGPIDRKWQFPFIFCPSRTQWTLSWRRWDTLRQRAGCDWRLGWLLSPINTEKLSFFIFIYLLLAFFLSVRQLFFLYYGRKLISGYTGRSHCSCCIMFTSADSWFKPFVDLNFTRDIKWTSHGDRNNCKTCWLVSILYWLSVTYDLLDLRTTFGLN